MSIKTIKKRIALVAVSALTAGAFSIVSAPSANANFTAGEVSFVTASGSNNSGACIITNTDAINTTIGTFRSGTIVVLEADTMVAGEDVFYTVSGPGVISSYTSQPAIVGSAGSVGAAVTSISATTLFDETVVVGDRLAIQLTGVGSVTVAMAVSSTAATLDTITITSVAACANTAFSATYSDISTTSSSTDNAWTANVDEQTSVEAGGSLYIRVDAENAYDANITSGTFGASATNGALVVFGANTGTSSATAGTTSFVSQADSDANGNFSVRVDPASAAAGGTTVITLTLGGVTIGTKNLTFFGEAKSIKVVTVRSGVTSGAISADTATGYFTFEFLSAAGTAVPGNGVALVTSTATTTVTTAATVKAPSSSSAVVVDAATGLADPQETIIGSTKLGVVTWTCGSSAGTSTLTFAHVNAISGDTILVSQALVCAGGIATYTVSTDKASYAVGEVATITIDAKDSAGGAVADSTVMAIDTVSAGGATLTRAILATDVFTAGKRTLQAQLTTAGTFNAVVSLTGSVTTSATTSYKVGDGAVSNAEILKSIVALIASINKQIAALQKLILKR